MRIPALLLTIAIGFSSLLSAAAKPEKHSVPHRASTQKGKKFKAPKYKKTKLKKPPRAKYGIKKHS
jgi:hypothetical protein